MIGQWSSPWFIIAVNFLVYAELELFHVFFLLAKVFLLGACRIGPSGKGTVALRSQGNGQTPSWGPLVVFSGAKRRWKGLKFWHVFAQHVGSMSLVLFPLPRKKYSRARGYLLSICWISAGSA